MRGGKGGAQGEGALKISWWGWLAEVAGFGPAACPDVEVKLSLTEAKIMREKYETD